jgi:DNA-binding NarL/FixJ family response regulator
MLPTSCGAMPMLCVYPIEAFTSPSQLSPRQREVTLRLIHGSTNREIAESLTVSERTAGNHVQSLMNVLGMRSRSGRSTLE